MEAGHLSRVRILYKTILRLHKGLPDEIRTLGDGYVRDEFKRHKKCNVKETATFMIEWTKYAATLAEQLGLQGPKTAQHLGKPLSLEQLDSMSDDQIQQLFELKLAAEGHNPGSEENKQ